MKMIVLLNLGSLTRTLDCGHRSSARDNQCDTIKVNKKIHRISSVIVSRLKETQNSPRIPMKVGNITRPVAGKPGESRQGG